MAGRTPDEPVSRPLVTQSWRHVTFLHWRTEPATVAAVLPHGVTPEVVDGSAWVSLLLFQVERFRLSFLPPVPRYSDFPQANLRTYVTGPDGQQGLWLLSVDAASLPGSVASRLGFGAPYFVTDMAIDVGPIVTYRAKRVRPQPAARIHASVEPGPPLAEAERTPLDDSLTGRWRAYTRMAGAWACGRVEHQPWPLHTTRSVLVDEDVTRAAGLPRFGAPDLVHWSPGVDARLSRPHSVRVVPVEGLPGREAG